MFDKVRIICEGYADKRLLRDFISAYYNIELSEDELKANNLIRHIENWKNITKEKVSITKANSSYRTLIFLDADDEATKEKNGLKETKNFVKTLMKTWDWKEYDVFVFPNNQNELGTIEDLFENIINDENKEIFACWTEYEKCIQSFSKYKIPAKKSKIFTYKECLNSLGNYNFKDTNLWDLNSSYLNPLKQFLDKNIE